jgi:hypothetical protein
MDCKNPHLLVHLVELIDEADPPVRQHHGTALQRPFASDWVLVDGCGEADR